MRHALAWIALALAVASIVLNGLALYYRRRAQRHLDTAIRLLGGKGT